MQFFVAALLGSAALARGGVFVESAINLPSAVEAFESRFDLDSDGRNDLLVIFQRRILVFFQQNDGSFPATPSLELGRSTPVPDDIACVSVGKVTSAPGLQLVLAGKHGVKAVVLDKTARNEISAQLVPVLETNLDLTPMPTLRFTDAAVDLDGDGRSELVWPNLDQLEIYEPDSSFRYKLKSRINLPFTTTQYAFLRREPELLGMPVLAERSMASDIVRPLLRHGRWYGVDYAIESASQPFLSVDFNGDGLLDFVTPKNVFYRLPKGGYQAEPLSVYDRIASSFGVYKSRVVVAPNLVDLNGDGRLDTFTVDVSATKLSPRTSISVYLGKQDRSFGEKPDFVLHTRDIAYSELVPLGDVNGDGALDLALFHLDFQPQSMESQLRAYLKNGLDGELRFYLWDKQRNRFLDVFSFKQRVLVNYEIYGARQLFQQQVFINHDMDGDGAVDLVMKTGPREISIYKNLGGMRGFTSRPFAVLHTPRPFTSFVVQDLDGDKRGDLIVSGYEESQEDRTIYSIYLNRL
ncbi:MAG: FG-GAP repeat domain-containing protein [Candidatus Sumerlaeaceae bacterium]|jgi:hypothetical protein